MPDPNNLDDLQAQINEVALQTRSASLTPTTVTLDATQAFVRSGLRENIERVVSTYGEGDAVIIFHVEHGVKPSSDLPDLVVGSPDEPSGERLLESTAHLYLGHVGPADAIALQGLIERLIENGGTL